MENNLYTDGISRRSKDDNYNVVAGYSPDGKAVSFSESAGGETKKETGEENIDVFEKALGRVEERVRYSLENKLLEELRKRVDDLQVKSIEILGLFMSLFTFISIDIQVLSSLDSVGVAVLFMIVLLVCMLIFLWVLHIMLHKDGLTKIYRQIRKIHIKWVVGIVCLFAAVLRLFWLIELPTKYTKRVDDLTNRIEKIESGNR